MPLDLFNQDSPLPPAKNKRNPRTRNKDGSWKINPMILTQGTTEGEKCKNCKHLFYRQFSKRYYKCSLRPNSGGASPAADHRVNFPACGLWEEE